MSTITNEILRQLKHQFSDLKFKVKVPLAKIAHFKIGGPAEVLVKTKTRQDLFNLVKFCYQQDLKFTILGEASNVIIADEGVSGLVILARHNDFKIVNNANGNYVLQIDSGANLSSVVKQTVSRGLSGLEPLVGVPGTLGGAIYNNAHYQDFLISDCVFKVEIINHAGEVIWLDREECDFAYDYTRFHNTKEVIMRAIIVLQKETAQAAEELMRKYTLHRMKTQPLGMPSSGCIFKNVPNNNRLKQLLPQFKDKDYVSVGLIIDQAGLKGMTEGSIQISKQHANFMINTNGGTAKDVKQLIVKVKTEVKNKYNLELEEEVFWID